MLIPTLSDPRVSERFATLNGHRYRKLPTSELYALIAVGINEN